MSNESMVTIPLSEYEDLKKKEKDLYSFQKGMKNIGIIDYRGNVLAVHRDEVLETIIREYNSNNKRMGKILEYYENIVTEKTGKEMWRLPLNILNWRK